MTGVEDNKAPCKIVRLGFYIQIRSMLDHRYLGSVIFAFLNTLTTTINHKTCVNTSGQVLEKSIDSE